MDSRRQHGAQTQEGTRLSPRNALEVNNRLHALLVAPPPDTGPQPPLQPHVDPPRQPDRRGRRRSEEGNPQRSPHLSNPGSGGARPSDSSVPTGPLGSSGTPQQRDERGVQACPNPPVSATDFSISGGEIGFKAPKLALFSGDKSAAESMSLDEWQTRWCSIARSKNWTSAERRSNLINSLTGKAYRLLSKQSFDPTLNDEAIEREIWLRLHRSFGQGEKQSFKKLIAMQFTIGQDTVDCYGADVRHNTVLAFKDLSTDVHDKIAAVFYWNTLPQTRAVKQSYGLWSSLPLEERSLTKAVDLTRPLFEVDDAGLSTQAQVTEEVAAVATAPSKGHQPHKGGKKGGKNSRSWSWSYGQDYAPWRGKGKGKGQGRSYRSTPYNWWRSQQCFACGGYGHRANSCPSKQYQSNQPPNKQVRAPSLSSSVLLISFKGSYFLVDSGCSITILSSSMSGLSGIKSSSDDRKRSINTIFQKSYQCQVITNISLPGDLQSRTTVVLSEVLLTDQPLVAVCRADGTNDRIVLCGILGLDWIKAIGGMCITFDGDIPVLHLTHENDRRSTQTSAIERVTPVNSSYYTGDTARCHVGVQCPDDTSGEIAESTSVEHLVHYGRPVTRELHASDVIVRRLGYPEQDGGAIWELQWRWVTGQAPQRHIMPPDYDVFVRKSPEIIEMFKEAIELWKDSQFIEATPLSDLQATHPLLCVEQLHKSTTPIRPCCDMRWANEMISSTPNENRESPLACIENIRRWRSFSVEPPDELVIIDLKKAYLCIFIDEDQSYWLGIRLRWEPHTAYRMVRMPFGLNVAPKTLSLILSDIRHQFIPMTVIFDMYVDDIITQRSWATFIRNVLLCNGFPTKEPTPLNQSRVLGLECQNDGTWRRRGTLPILDAQPCTRRAIHRWAGKFIGHYPIARWGRPAAAALKRIATLRPSKAELNWDEPVEKYILQARDKLMHELSQRGDPIGGEWSYCKTDEWILFTDASKYALGAVLTIGGVYVEDFTRLRSLRDKRHINLVELEAVILGIQLVSKYVSALHIQNQRIRLKCDSQSVVSWITRHQERHWRAVRGLNATLVESRLKTFQDTCQALQLELTVELIASADNIADALSRIPDYCVPPTQENPDEELDELIAALLDETGSSAHVEARDDHGRLIMAWGQELRYLATMLHEHEGAKSLYERMRRLVNCPHLKQQCNNFVAACDICSTGKITKSAPAQLGVSFGQCELRAQRPWQTVHMDISGPFHKVSETMYVIALVDNWSSYTVTRTVLYTPTTEDCLALFRVVDATFNTTPESLHTDQGTQFVSTAFAGAMNQVSCQHVRSPVFSSWCNGKCERMFRIINERIRCRKDPSELSFLTFKQLVRRATQLFNTAISGRTTYSPHEMIFTYEPWIFPRIPAKYRPGVRENTQNDTIDESNLPTRGDLWLMRKMPRGKKHERPYLVVRILNRLSPLIYRVLMPDSRKRIIHLKYLKKVAPSALEKFDKSSIPPLPNNF